MDKFKQLLMEQTLLDYRTKLDSETAEAYSFEILLHIHKTDSYNLLAKKLFHKIAKGGFIRGPMTERFMECMLSGKW